MLFLLVIDPNITGKNIFLGNLTLHLFSNELAGSNSGSLITQVIQRWFTAATPSKPSWSISRYYRSEWKFYLIWSRGLLDVSRIQVQTASTGSSGSFFFKHCTGVQLLTLCLAEKCGHSDQQKTLVVLVVVRKHIALTSIQG